MMICGPTGPRRYVEHNYTALRMVDCFDIHTKTEPRKQLLGNIHAVKKGVTPHDFSGRRIFDPEKKVTTALIGDGNTVLAKLTCVVLVLGLFEFKALML